MPLKTLAQKYDIYQPAFWMYNFTLNDTLQHLKLNSHLPLFLNSSTNWYTKNKTKESNNLFIVYKTNNSDDDLVSVIGNKHALFISSSNVQSTDTLDISGYNQNFGELLDLRFGDVGNGILMLNNGLKDSNIYEVLLDNNLSSERVNEIRTYLSIKYGIDLINSNQYIYKKQKLWNRVKNNDNIFGIGKFSYFNLIQKQSIHSKDKDFQIKFSNDVDFKNVKDGDFVLVGNNSKALSFIKDHCSKKWTIQSNINTNIDILINSSLISDIDSNFSYFIEVNGKRYEPILIENNLVFADVLVNQQTLDVELRRENYEFDFLVNSDCESFILEFKKNILLSELKIIDDKGVLRHDNLDLNKIQVEINQNKYFDILYNFKDRPYKRRFYTNIEFFPKSPVNLNYSLEQGPFEIIPKIDYDKKFIYSWFFNDNKIFEGGKLLVKEPGNYKLVITDSSGCSKNYKFYVSENKVNSSNDFDESWKIYPNPSFVNTPIFNKFNFTNARNVELKIFSLEGKLIKSLPKQQVFNEDVVFSLPSSGTYMVVAYIDEEIQIKKLIVE